MFTLVKTRFITKYVLGGVCLSLGIQALLSAADASASRPFQGLAVLGFGARSGATYFCYRCETPLAWKIERDCPSKCVFRSPDIKTGVLGDASKYLWQDCASEEIAASLKEKNDEALATLVWRQSGLEKPCRLYLPLALARRYLNSINEDGAGDLPLDTDVDVLWVLMQALEKGLDLEMRTRALREMVSGLGKGLKLARANGFLRMLGANKEKFADDLGVWAAYLCLLLYQKMPVAEIKKSLGWVLENRNVLPLVQRALTYYKEFPGEPGPVYAGERDGATAAWRAFAELLPPAGGSGASALE